MIVLDNNGCRDTLDLSLVDTNYHQIDIGYNTLVLEAGEPIDFYEITNDTSVIWNWDFGDDSTSNLSEPTHMYNYAGTYTICLVASNQYGCTDTACVELELEPAEIVIPTIFTPNGDLTNDLFEKESIFKNKNTSRDTDVYTLNKELFIEDMKMIHEFIEFKYFKKVMNKNKNILD